MVHDERIKWVYLHCSTACCAVVHVHCGDGLLCCPHFICLLWAYARTLTRKITDGCGFKLAPSAQYLCFGVSLYVSEWKTRTRRKNGRISCNFRLLQVLWYCTYGVSDAAGYLFRRQCVGCSVFVLFHVPSFWLYRVFAKSVPIMTACVCRSVWYEAKIKCWTAVVFTCFHGFSTGFQRRPPSLLFTTLVKPTPCGL